MPDNFSCLVDFAAGAYAVVSQTLSAFGHHQTAKVTGSEGTIWAHWSAADARSEKSSFALRYGLGENVTHVDLETPAGELLELAEQIRAVVQCVQTNSQPPCTGNDGRWSAALCLAAAESIQQRRAVCL